MNTYTDITIVLDRSGSMHRIEVPTIEGFNDFLTEHQALKSNVKLTLAQFNNDYEVVYQNKPINNVQYLNSNTFSPRGATALLDAIGKTIDNKKKYIKALDVSKRPNHIIIAIITDGFENTSKVYTKNEILQKINKRTKRDHWTFVFIGANQDAISEGSKFGFSKDRCLSMKFSKAGVNYAFKSFTNQSKRVLRQDKYDLKFTKSDLEKQKD